MKNNKITVEVDFRFNFKDLKGEEIKSITPANEAIGNILVNGHSQGREVKARNIDWGTELSKTGVLHLQPKDFDYILEKMDAAQCSDIVYMQLEDFFEAKRLEWKEKKESTEKSDQPKFS